MNAERFSFESKPGFAQHHETSKVVIVPDAHLLFSGDYVRIGNDLIISGPDQKFVVGNYFKGESRPSLATKDGATLSGHIIDALTGHVHYAQATAPVAGQIIGHVLKLSGSATVIRNGVSIELHIGDAVQKGDVVQTGADSSIGLTFIDGSAFGMTSNARMVLNEMIFDPNGSSNSSLISLVQGTITFVAGQTAKNGNMRVETPVATMGIRGTAVLVEIASNDGPTKFSVLVEPDGHTGSYNLYDKVSGQLIGTVSQAGQVTFVSSLGLGQPPSAVEQLKTMQDQQAEKAIIQQVFQLYFPNYNPDSKPNSTKSGSSSGNNLAEIIIGTFTFNGQTAISSIELRFAPPDTLPGTSAPPPVIYHNTKAKFSTTGVTAEQSYVSTFESFKIADHVKIDDPDVGNGPFYDIATPFVPGSATIKSATSTISFVDEDFLTPLIHIDQQTGVVSFDRQKFSFLAEGESVTITIRVLVSSGPDSDYVLIPITITGTNDAPTIVGGAITTVEGAVTEDTYVSPTGRIAADGVITFRDVDLTDTHTASFSLTSASSTLPGFDGSKPIGTFTIDPVSESSHDLSDTGTVNWHFSLSDDDPVLQSLAEGQTITQTYTITIVDEHGVSVTQIITVTITGTNDNAVITLETGDHDTGGVADPGGVSTGLHSGTETTSGTISFTDVDLIDTHSISSITSADGTLGHLTAVIDTDSTGGKTGSLKWTYSVDDDLIRHLADGETKVEVFEIKIFDGTSWVTTTVTVTITGTNDAPTLASVDAGTIVDTSGPHSFETLTGHLTGSDADHGETASLTYAALNADHDAVNTGIRGLYGTLTVNPDGTYTYVPNADAIKALLEGKYVDTFDIITTDVHDAHGTAKLVIHIDGVDDAPTMDVTSASVMEGVGLRGHTLTHTFTLHDLMLNDVDAKSGEVFTLKATSEHGTLSLDGDHDGVHVDGAGTHELSLSGSLEDIQDALMGRLNGLKYDTDKLLDSKVEHVTTVLTDGHGVSDTLTFVFQQNSLASGTLTGTSGNDVIFSNWGSDSMWGLGGKDVFVFDGLRGKDVINDFHHGEDIIDIKNAFKDFEDLLAHTTTDAHGNAVISLGPHGPGSITITGIDKLHLSSTDFHLA